MSSVVLGNQLFSSKKAGSQAWGGSACGSPTPQTREARAQVDMEALSLHSTGTLSVGELIRKRARGFFKCGWACPKIREPDPESLWVEGHELDCSQWNKIETWGIIWATWVIKGSRNPWGFSLRFKTTEIINYRSINWIYVIMNSYFWNKVYIKLWTVLRKVYNKCKACVHWAGWSPCCELFSFVQ